MTDQTNKEAADLTKETSNEEEDSFVVRKYNEVVRNADLIDIKMISSNFRVEPEYYIDKAKRRLEYSSGYPKWVDFNDEEGFALGTFDWEVRCKHGRKTVLSIKARYMIIYNINREVEPKYARDFVANVGRFAIFPYFRSLVSQYSAASSTDLPLLPVLKQRIADTPREED